MSFATVTTVLAVPEPGGRGGGSSSGSGIVNVKTNDVSVGGQTNINIILGAGLTTSVVSNDTANSEIDINLIVSGGAATNAIALLNGRGTNTGFNSLTIDAGAFTNAVTSTHSGSSTFSGGVTNTGIIRTTGGITHTAGVTNSAHLRMTGWRLLAEASAVNWCGHRREWLLLPTLDGVTARLVPILGEAA